MVNHNETNDVLGRIYERIINGDEAAVKEGVQESLKTGHEPERILNGALIAAMDEVGRKFEAQEFYVPEMLIAARAMKSGLSVLKPHLIRMGIKPVAKVIVGTVKGDLHDIGKNLVAMMLEGAGFEVIDLGVDVSRDMFIKAVEEHQPRFVGMSALLTTTMPQMREMIEALSEKGLRDQVTVMVGGAPVTRKYADDISADLYAPDAATAAQRAKELLEI
jgi:5-methyltetrahydrofolate--homocysteine methyltransferase